MTSRAPTCAAAHLAGADCAGALLIGADLRDPDLRDADLIGADLRAADLRGADLTGALFLTEASSSRRWAMPRRGSRTGCARPAHWRSAREEVEQQ